MKNKNSFISKIASLVLCGIFVITAFSGCESKNTYSGALVSNAPRIAIYTDSECPYSHMNIHNDEMFTLRMTHTGINEFALTDYTNGKITFRKTDYTYDMVSMWLADNCAASNPKKTFVAKAEDGKEITVGYFPEMTYPVTFKMKFCSCGDFFEKVMRVTNSSELETEYIDIFTGQLQDLFDELDADIDISEYEFVIDKFLYMKGGVKLQEIQAFYCSHCKNVVGYTVTGTPNPDEVYDLIPQYTSEQWEDNVLLPALEKYLSY
jgi:hypothetical protein